MSECDFSTNSIGTECCDIDTNVSETCDIDRTANDSYVNSDVHIAENVSNAVDGILSNSDTSIQSILPPFNPNFYAQFWDKTYELFLSVSHPYTPCEQCLNCIEGKHDRHAFSTYLHPTLTPHFHLVILSDLVVFVRKEKVSSLAIALVLDVIVQVSRLCPHSNYRM